MPETMPSTVTAERGRLSIRLPQWGWFLLATVLLVVGFLGLSIWLPYHREQQVIQKIEDWGGNVLTERVGPEWLRKCVGADRIKRVGVFERVVEVNLARTKVSDEKVPLLSRLSHLRKLSLAGTAVTDAGVAHLGSLTNLRELWLNWTAVTDAGLNQLNRLPNVESLHLEGTAVTGTGFVPMSGYTSLRRLFLTEARVTDAGLTGLSRLTNLRFLHLEDQLTDGLITADGIKELRNALPNCNIRHWRITHHGPFPPFPFRRRST
jgi:hypothetical protein